jgi:hypothetical protein
MKKFLSGAVIAAGVLMAQGMYAPEEVSGLIDHVHEDLNRAYPDGWKFSKSDHNRLNDAEKDLREFSNKWSKNRFDKGQLNGAISKIQHVVDQNHMPPDDRNALDSDLSQLVRMREAYDRHEIGYQH